MQRTHGLQVLLRIVKNGRTQRTIVPLNVQDEFRTLTDLQEAHTLSRHAPESLVLLSVLQDDIIVLDHVRARALHHVPFPAHAHLLPNALCYRPIVLILTATKMPLLANLCLEFQQVHG
jgi:hypothetical protein